MAETRTELTPLAKMLLGSIVAIVILIGVAIGGSALFGGNKNQQLVILKAETEPHKVAPAEKGGLKINSIDSPVLSLLDKAEELEEGVEVLRPPVSEPEPPPIEVTEDVEPEETADPAAAPENTETAATETEAASEQKAEITVIEPAEVVNITPKAEDVPEEDKAEEDKAEDSQEEDEITQAISSIPKARPNTPKIVATTDVNSPSYVVQFAAFKNETRAKNTAAVLSTKHKSRLDGMAIGYMRWGDYWRVVAEPMPRADANSLCSMFRSVGQECIIKLMETPNG